MPQCIVIVDDHEPIRKLVRTLQNRGSAEVQLIKALPKMAKASKSPDLRKAFAENLDETERHLKRVKQVFELINEKPKRLSCEAMQRLVSEGDRQLK